jgi:aminoglycoside 3-N-acetyltransferase
MVSMAYLSSAYEYLKEGKPFDVRKTPSYMGMVSESFRRHPGVRRSLNPVHPVLAFGPEAAWLVEGHESCQYPCGHGSPFEKLAELHSKFLFYDASLHTLTFFHYLEHLVQDRLDFPIYHHELLQTQVIDAEGQARALQTYVYAPAAIARRNPDKMHEFLERKGQIPSVRVGNSRLQLMHADDLVQVVADMAAQGVVFYD